MRATGACRAARRCRFARAGRALTAVAPRPRATPRPLRLRSQNHSLSVLAVDEATGRLSMVANVPSGGKAPRHFQISAAGDFLVAANQTSNDIALFRIDPNSGMLSKPAIAAVPVSPRAICIVEDGSAAPAPK